MIKSVILAIICLIGTGAFIHFVCLNIIVKHVNLLIKTGFYSCKRKTANHIFPFSNCEIIILAVRKMPNYLFGNFIFIIAVPCAKYI